MGIVLRSLVLVLRLGRSKVNSGESGLMLKSRVSEFGPTSNVFLAFGPGSLESDFER